MRHPIPRALALLAAVAGPLVAVPPAHAAWPPAPTCAFGTELAEFDVIGGGHWRVAISPVSPTEYNVCVQAATDVVLAVVVVRTDLAATPPAVTTTPGTGACDTTIVDMTAPVELELSVGPGTGGAALCVGKDGATTGIGFTGPSVQAWPRPAVWLPAGSVLLTYGWCGALYAYQVAFPTAYNQGRWTDCHTRDTWVY